MGKNVNTTKMDKISKSIKKINTNKTKYQKQELELYIDSNHHI